MKLGGAPAHMGPKGRWDKALAISPRRRDDALHPGHPMDGRPADAAARRLAIARHGARGLAGEHEFAANLLK
jgi:hypothetical protein